MISKIAVLVGYNVFVVSLEFGDRLRKTYLKDVARPLLCIIVSGEEDPRIVGFYLLDEKTGNTSQTSYNKEDETRETGTG